MAAKSKVSQPGLVDSWTPHQAWFSSVTGCNRGKADVVVMSWQQVLTPSACKKEKNRQRFLLIFISRLQVNGQKGQINSCLQYAKLEILVKYPESSTVSVSSLLKLEFTSSVAVNRQAQLKEDLPHTERKNHNRSLWRRNEIVRADLNRERYR